MPRISSPNGHDFTEVAACLRQFDGQELVFVPNPGNAGDAIINLGMYRLFDRLGVRYVTGSQNQDYPGRVVVCSGGGALVDLYPDSHLFYERNHKNCAALILLPHTVRAHGTLIAEMGSNCFVFAREKNSMAYLERHAKSAHIGLAHDMAFFLGASDIKAMHWHPGQLRRLGLLVPWIVMYLKFQRERRVRGETALVCVRNDVEETAVRPDGRVFDLSSLFATGEMSRESCENIAKIFYAVTRLFDKVITNRLHVGIMATIMGMNVDFHDNNYGKNSDIYHHSINNYFPNTILFDHNEPFIRNRV